jgi:hypothetical protein
MARLRLIDAKPSASRPDPLEAGVGRFVEPMRGET